MSKLRLSLWRLMVLIGFFAVGLAALRNPTELWASFIYTITFGLLLVSLIGIAFRQGNKRLFWLGCGVFGWGYFIHALAIKDFEPPSLLPVHAISYFYKKMPTSLVVPITGRSKVTAYFVRESLTFFQICHSLTILLVGMLGAFIVRIFAIKHKDTHATKGP